MDRNTQADDNAEHLYRYILNNNLKEDCYFALNRDSSDWARLEQEGFKLLEFGSDNFESKLKHCSKIISSHLDKYVNNYFGDEYEYSKKFVFLQHGITKDDMSSWFNGKKNLQCLVAATQPEYNSIADSNTHYKLTNKEVILTGFPRHDSLLAKNLDEKIILIMPTWRNTIVGKTIGGGNERVLNDTFMQTLYAQSWYKLIHSQQLKQLVVQYGYKVVFAPHANIVPYLDQFSIPPYMSIWSIGDQVGSIQNLFQQSKIMLTDYSSVAFEMAYLDKAIIYYQFDKDTIYQGGHIYQKGYFEYECDGFGPVVEAVEEVTNALEQILVNDGRPLLEYLERMQNTFIFKDGQCCKRVYDAVIALDHEDDSENLDLAREFLDQAYRFKDYELVAERAENLLKNTVITDQKKLDIAEKLAESYLKLKQWGALESLLIDYQFENYQLELLAYNKKWSEIINLIGKDIVLDQYLNLRLSSLFNIKEMNTLILAYENFINKIVELNEYDYELLKCYVAYAKKDWLGVLEIIAQIEILANQNQYLLSNFTRDDLAYMKLMASKNSEKLDLNVVKKLNSGSLDFVLQKSLILSGLNQSKEALKGFEITELNLGLKGFDIDALMTYMSGLVELKNWSVLNEKLPECLIIHPEELFFKEIYIQSLFEMKLFKDLVQFVENYPADFSYNIRFKIIMAYYRLGNIEGAYSMLTVPSIDYEYSYWLLALEIYMQIGDDEQVKSCIKRMYAVFPEKMKETKDKYNSLTQLFTLS